MFQARITKGEINLERTKTFVTHMHASGGTGIRHQHVLGVLALLFEDVGGGGSKGLVVPETLDIEASDMDELRYTHLVLSATVFVVSLTLTC